MHIINANTQVVIAVFALIYVIFLTAKTARQQLDLYDLVMLSAVAIVPVGFAFQPELAYWLAELAGVMYPFVLMFGALFLIIFVFVYRLTIRIHQLEKANLLAVQEIGLLQVELKLTSRAFKPSSTSQTEAITTNAVVRSRNA